MAKIDPEQERTRLAAAYAGQTNEGLEQIAAQVSDLTEIGREVLRAELSKRGLYVGQLDQPAGVDVEEFRDLVTIRAFWNLLEAQMAKGLLDAEGIESFLFDENMVRLDWFNANALGGVKLRVDAANADEATRILEESIAAAAAEPQSEDEDSPA